MDDLGLRLDLFHPFHEGLGNHLAILIIRANGCDPFPGVFGHEHGSTPAFGIRVCRCPEYIRMKFARISHRGGLGDGGDVKDLFRF